MCIVVDINTMASVFDINCSQHKDFKPVLDWVIKGRGKIVYGGTKYIEELNKVKKYIPIIGQLKKAGKAIEVDKNEVDLWHSYVEKKENDPDFDDPHIVGLMIASKCLVVCTKDARSFKFLKKKELYPKWAKRPKIYCSLKNINLLSDKNITEICKPCVKYKVGFK